MIRLQVKCLQYGWKGTTSSQNNMKTDLDMPPKTLYIKITTGVIMDKYTELYAWMWKTFGEEEFTLDRMCERYERVFQLAQSQEGEG